MITLLEDLEAQFDTNLQAVADRLTLLCAPCIFPRPLHFNYTNKKWKVLEDFISDNMLWTCIHDFTHLFTSCNLICLTQIESYLTNLSGRSSSVEAITNPSLLMPADPSSSRYNFTKVNRSLYEILCSAKLTPEHLKTIQYPFPLFLNQLNEIAN